MMKSRKIVIDIAQNEYEALDKLDAEYLLHIIRDGTMLPDGAEILTREAYSDLCLRASKGNKTGRWSVNEVGVVRCPFCHANMNPRKNRKPKYCDECGAKLEEIKKC